MNKTAYWTAAVLLAPGFILGSLELLRMVFALARYAD